MGGATLTLLIAHCHSTVINCCVIADRLINYHIWQKKHTHVRHRITGNFLYSWSSVKFLRRCFSTSSDSSSISLSLDKREKVQMKHQERLQELWCRDKLRPPDAQWLTCCIRGGLDQSSVVHWFRPMTELCTHYEQNNLQPHDCSSSPDH